MAGVDRSVAILFVLISSPRSADTVTIALDCGSYAQAGASEVDFWGGAVLTQPIRTPSWYMP